MCRACRGEAWYRVPCGADPRTRASQHCHAVGCPGVDRWAVHAERCSIEPRLGSVLRVRPVPAPWRSAPHACVGQPPHPPPRQRNGGIPKVRWASDQRHYFFLHLLLFHL